MPNNGNNGGLNRENLKNQKLIEELVNSIKSLLGLRITPLTLEDITQAAKLMKKYNLDYEDAIRLASVLSSKAKEIISNDEFFDRTTLKDLAKKQ
ncbi:MAG: type II toxin-antitoxin system VapC family toxin [Candidatus Bathyarchaeota archaeon]